MVLDWFSCPLARTSSPVSPAFLEADALEMRDFWCALPLMCRQSLSLCVWCVLLAQMCALLPIVTCVNQTLFILPCVQRFSGRWKEGALMACRPPSHDAFPVPCRHFLAVPCRLSTAPGKLLSPFSHGRMKDVMVPSSRFLALTVSLSIRRWLRLRDVQCHCRTVGSVGDSSLRSDRILVLLTIKCRRV